MPSTFSLPGRLSVRGVPLKDPRVFLRIVIGVLLAANLVAAVIAFKPFGGSAEDLQQAGLTLQKMNAHLKETRAMVEKVKTARSLGDQFLAKYFMDERTASATVLNELDQISTQAGVRSLAQGLQRNEIEGSDTLEWVSITLGVEGTYANLTKFVNLLEKSPRFLIIESLQAAAPQQQQQQVAAQREQPLNVTLKVDAFVNGDSGVMP